MPFAAAIKFKQDSFSKYYNPRDLQLAQDDFCVVKDPSLGVERVGFVSCLEGRAAVQMPHLPLILRLATEREIELWYELKIQEKEMLGVARERVAAHNLPIKISDLNFLEDKRQVLLHFTSENRIDFRELVKDLGGRLKARIEMWQIGARKEAGMQDGMGICGQKLCCSCWLKEFPTVSMRHAKDQDIIQPPSKLSGPCGRLRCCLRYEHEAYVQMAAGLPNVGESGCAKKGGGCGVIFERNILARRVTIRREGGALETIEADEFVPDPNAPPPQRRGSGRSRRRDDDDRDAPVRDDSD